MHVRVRIFGKPDTIVVVESRLTKIDQFRRILNDKFGIDPKLQRLLYGGKLLENGYTFHDYNIKINDVIQVMVSTQPEGSPKEKTKCDFKEQPVMERATDFKDAESTLYAIGDLIDIRDRTHGGWLEGTITRIVYNPDVPKIPVTIVSEVSANLEHSDNNQSFEKENDVENKPPNDTNGNTTKTVRSKGIGKYFLPATKPVQKKISEEKKTSEVIQNTDDTLLYEVKLDSCEEESNLYCKVREIRPRARTVLNITDLQIGQKVMINHNLELPLETGYWYDLKLLEVRAVRLSHELIGTLFIGPDAVPQDNTKVRVHDKIFAIEETVPVMQRTDEYKKKISTTPEKRSVPLDCLTCRDDEDTPCKDCGCYSCSSKECPEKILLCDECNHGFHTYCIEPPLKEIPDEDWYCPSCKRDPNDVIAPGAAKQIKKSSKTSRDWGRGMACVGKTKSSAMPPNHFGPIPGIEVGMSWRFRIQLSETGVHRPPVSGIHGRDVDGAYSIVLSGGYEDDVDNGNEFTYTGSGGRDLSGNKRTAEQSCDQTLTRENRALARNCAVKQITENGGDAKDDWRDGKPVRVVRSYKMLKHFPKYAPKEGIRYDGIYKVVKYYPEKGLSGYRVWKYLLRRDDASPAPWEPGSKQYPIIYPDGYLEAEAEKKALKAKNISKSENESKRKQKRALNKSNQSTELKEESPPLAKKRKTSRGRPVKNSKQVTSESEEDVSLAVKTQKDSLTEESDKKSLLVKIPITNVAGIFTKKTDLQKKNEHVEQDAKPKADSALTEEEREAIKNDTLNINLWNDCLAVFDASGKKEFVEHVSQMFLCIICQDVATSPVTTPCLHNFCSTCLKLAFKSTGPQCPCCRHSLSDCQMNPNEKLKIALQTILPGYDVGKR